MSSPFATESLTDADGLVVLTSPDGTVAGTAVVERLASIPCVVIAAEQSGGGISPLADVAPEEGVASVDDILRIIEDHPVSATSLAILLRGSNPSFGAALAAESAVFSLLESGREFKAWLDERPVHREGHENGPAVRLAREADTLEIVLNRPHARNALNRAMRDELLNGLALAASDPTIADVVLRGEGSNFCSGGDLGEFGTFDDPASAHMVRLIASVGRAIDALGPRLTVQVHGPCAGSGVELPAFAARVEARRDFTATLPEVQLGLIPGAGGTVSITRRIGRHRTALLALSGARIDATTALRWGLIDRVVPW